MSIPSFHVKLKIEPLQLELLTRETKRFHLALESCHYLTLSFSKIKTDKISALKEIGFKNAEIKDKCPLKIKHSDSYWEIN